MSYLLTKMMFHVIPDRWPRFSNKWVARAVYPVLFFAGLLPATAIYLIGQLLLLVWHLGVVALFQAVSYKLLGVGHLLAGNWASTRICFSQAFPDPHWSDICRKSGDRRKLQALWRRFK